MFGNVADDVPCQPLPTEELLKLLLIAAFTMLPTAVSVTLFPAQIVLFEAVKFIAQPGIPDGEYNPTLADHPGD